MPSLIHEETWIKRPRINIIYVWTIIKKKCSLVLPLKSIDQTYEKCIFPGPFNKGDKCIPLVTSFPSLRQENWNRSICSRFVKKKLSNIEIQRTIKYLKLDEEINASTKKMYVAWQIKNALIKKYLFQVPRSQLTWLIDWLIDCSRFV